MKIRDVAVALALAYSAGTAAIGYDQARNFVGPLGASFGPAYADQELRAHSPDWETVSPTFWLGAERGFRDARAELGAATSWVPAGGAQP